MQDLTGKQIGRYKILKSIGEGGMASVYLAEDTNLERLVALKVIRAERVTPEQLPRIMERFKREAKALARLSDEPGIVTVYDYGEFEGTPYLVMAYMPGGTLKDRLGSPIQPQAAAEMLLPIARALGEAHAQGVIHRDVKPSNLLVDKHGSLALADFGIAKALEMEGQTLTSTGMGVGTPEYMAPEQWRGGATPQTDVYSLGVVLYEMITGKKPFRAENPSDIYLKQMTEEPPDPERYVNGLPANAVAVLKKAMERQPEARYADMGAFRAALMALAAGGPAHDETPVAAVLPKPPDLEATYDELSTPAEPVRPRVAAPVQPGEEKPKAGLPGQRRWWLAGAGAVLVLGLVWAMGGGVKGNGLLGGQATKTATITSLPTETPVPEPTLEVGSIMISEKDGMEMVYVPAGAFTMGSNDGDADEKPVHEVYLDGYWIDKYEVTNAQYAKCVAEGDCDKQVKMEYANHPVVQVSWIDAHAYCAWAGRRLPSEAEWEKAARGTDGRTYPWGFETPSASQLNYNLNEGGMTAVGNYPAGASPYGALDMAGNVWEWVADWYDAGYYSKSPLENPPGPDSGTYRVLRGGSWLVNGRDVRSADRNLNFPVSANDYLGFRCSVSDPLAEITQYSSNEPTILPSSIPTLVPDLTIGSTRISKVDGMEQVYVPVGTFIMGSNDGDSDEQPVHEVYLDGYWIDKYEVTNAQYAKCVVAGECVKPSDTQYYENGQYANHPVVNVSWYNANDYCAWAGRRLPSEAEWEKAARGTDGRTYPWGNGSPSASLLNYNGSYGSTTTIGSYPVGVSPYGALDMAGNVWEWTSSLYKDYPYAADDGREDTNASGWHVLRGGSWSYVRGVRSAIRSEFISSLTNYDLGFRCASSEAAP